MPQPHPDRPGPDDGAGRSAASAGGPDRPGPRRSGPLRSGPLRSRWRAFGAGLQECYVAPYRRTFARAQRDEDDLFLMLVLSELLGVPNPAAFYTAELLPVVYDDFHDWHRRMGMDRSPLEHLSCC